MAEHGTIAHTTPDQLASFDHMAGMASAVTASARRATRSLTEGHSEIGSCLTRMMQDAVAHAAEGFEAVARARTPSQAGQRYFEFLGAATERNMRQVGHLGQVVARQHARLFERPAPAASGAPTTAWAA